MERPSHCLNCDGPLQDAFCSRCGQKAIDLKAPFHQLVGGVLGDALGVDSRLKRTVVPFLVRPGQLAVEYNAGRRLRYLPPIKLYLFMSFLLFLSASFAEQRFLNVTTTSAPGPATEKVKEAVPDLVYEQFVSRISQIIFLFVPIFALLLKLLYLRQNVFYIQHLTFSAYYQAFVFFLMWFSVLLIVFGVPKWPAFAVNLAINIVISCYLYLALRRVYGQSPLKTLVKMVVLIVTYVLLVLIVLLATLFSISPFN